MPNNTKGKKNKQSNRNNTNNAAKGSKEFESKLLNDIKIIVMCAVALLLFICCLGLGGMAGEFVSKVLFGLFGLLAYVVPWLLLIGIFLLMFNKGSKVALIKFISGVVFVLSLCTFIWLVVPSFSMDDSVIRYFEMSADDKSYGGILGGVIAKLLCNFTGKIGAFIIVVVLFIVAIILISERSILSKLDSGRREAAEVIADNTRALRDEREIKRQERKISREEDRIRAREEWEEEKKRRREELEVRKQNVAKMKGNVTLDTKIVPPDPNAVEIVPEKKEKPKKTMNIEDSISSQNVTEIILPELDFEDTSEPNDYISSAREIFSNEDTNDSKVNDNIRESVADKNSTGELLKEKPADKARTEYKFPSLNLLKKGNSKSSGDSASHIKAMETKLVETLANFGVRVKILNTACGPTVTRYELQPEQGVKVSKILSLADDIKLNLAAPDIRIEAPIPGKAAIGIEVPNKNNVAVMLRDLLESKEFIESESKLTTVIGKDIGGNIIVSNIAKMPHLLIAGATGSGKSVCINTIIMSILYKARPDEVKLIMIDPKVVELSIYNGIPHLMIPVVTDPKKAAGALNWAVGEMTNRYQAFAREGVRDLKGYNQKMLAKKNEPDYNPDLHEVLPQILIAVDELADLMMVAPRDVEDAICRLAQLARAAGIHLIIATQRPSVDVITGLIKANMPSRLALSVSSGVDSRTIIDMNGAEKLLGNGDMLFYPQGYQKPHRIQGAYVSDEEVGAVAEFLKQQAKGEVSYNQDIEEQIASAASSGASGAGNASSDDNDNGYDELFVQAGKLIIECEKASIGNLQRRLRIGFNRAARIMDQLCEAGVVGEEEGTKPRTILMSMEQFEQFIEEYY